MANGLLNFSQYTKRYGEDGIRRVALEYATSDYFTTIDKVAEGHGITVSAVKSIIAYAITHCLISYQMCLDIKKKAHGNQSRHIHKGERKPSPSDQYYDKLINERIPFIRAIRGDRAKRAVEFYVNNPDHSIEFIANALGFSVQEADILLRNSIIFGIADDEEVSSILEIAVNKKPYPDKKSAKEAIEKYISYRNDYAARKLSISVLQYNLEYNDDVSSQIELLEYQIDSYDSYFISGEGPEKEELQRQLEYLENMPSKEELESQLKKEIEELEAFEAMF